MFGGTKLSFDVTSSLGEYVVDVASIGNDLDRCCDLRVIEPFVDEKLPRQSFTAVSSGGDTSGALRLTQFAMPCMLLWDGSMSGRGSCSVGLHGLQGESLFVGRAFESRARYECAAGRGPGKTSDHGLIRL